MLAASMGSWAQTSAPTPPNPPEAPAKALATVVVTDKAEGKDALRATTTGIGKGNQALRDIPQSVTVVTEKLIDDRNLDTLKEALRNTAGITFQAAEGGEEDIRLRGFSLATTGDLFLDGMRDPAFYDRDTFNLDRLEVLRGSASMLFGRGSTGGAVNQVSKLPRLMTEHEVSTAAGNHGYARVTGDFNWHTGEDAAVRLNVMKTQAHNNGAGASVDKQGAALTYRWGIGTADEFLLQAYALDNRNGVNYGIPWIKARSTDTSASNTLVPGLSPTDSYAMTSDRNVGSARFLGGSQIHRFGDGSELKTQIRAGHFERDLRASAVRFVDPTTDLSTLNPLTALRRGNNFKIQDVDTLHAQSDLSKKFEALGFKHELQTGIDLAREAKTVYTPRTAAQGGVDLTKPNTIYGNPSPYGWVDEDSRVLRESSNFVARGWGVYAQDLVQVAPHWKLLGGLRYDRMSGRYKSYSIPSDAAGPVTASAYEQKIGEWSKRLGALYQPTERHSFHFSYGTSFNTSGDTYSYSALSANTPPEKSENIELGAKIDSADKRFSTRWALFRSTKLNERNTDPDTSADRLLLSGKRHAAGLEVDWVGRITPKWEVYGSYMWLPVARVDQAASTMVTAGNREGDRPGLSPRQSGTAWTTYQLTPQWRVGGGLNFRGRQSPADATAPGWEAPGFVTADLMAEYRVSDLWSIKGNLINLANTYYADQLYRGHYIPGPGRLAQVTLTARF